MRVLLVEDGPGIYNFVKQGLEKEAFTVEVSDNGKDRLKLALSGTYDLLLPDWILPGKSGIAICREFRKSSKKTPINFPYRKRYRRGNHRGITERRERSYQKALSFFRPMERIRLQLRDSGRDENELLAEGKIVLNKTARQVFENGEEVHLTQREFDLPQFLLERKGKVCAN